MDKGADAFRTISEVAEELDLPQHVLRFWETRFTQIKPLKRGGGRRYYRPDDVDLVQAIKQLLYGDGYTIKGVQRILKEQGARVLVQMAQNGQIFPVSQREDTGREAVEPQPSDVGFPGNLHKPATQNSYSAANKEFSGLLLAALAEIEECSRLLANAR